MTREELRDYVDEQRTLNNIPYHVYSALIDGIDTLEQEPILDKIRAEIVDTLYVDSLIFGELIDFMNGKISADDVIEEFNQVTRTEVLKIIDKYKAESESQGSDTEVRKPCINYEDGCEEWAGCPCVHYKGRK